MKAIILAAGYATRLYPLTLNTPKPLLKINELTIIDYLLDKVDEITEINRVIVVSNNKFYNQFSDALSGRIKERPGRYKIINDGSNTVDDRLGAIGDIRLAVESENFDDDFLILGGDGFFDFGLKDFLQFAALNRAHHSLCLYQPLRDGIDFSSFGIALVDQNSRLTEFEEKPLIPRSNLIATCIYYLPKEKLRLLPEYLDNGNHKDAPGSYISWLIKTDRVYGLIASGAWYDLGDLKTLNEVREQEKSQNKVESSYRLF